MGARRKARRLRQARRSADASARPGASRVRGRRGRRVGKPAGSGGTSTRSCAKVRAPTGSSTCFARRAICERSSATWSRTPKPVSSGKGLRRDCERSDPQGRAALWPGVQFSAGVHRQRQSRRRCAWRERRDGPVWRDENGRAVPLSSHRRSHFPRGGVLPWGAEACGPAGHLRHQQPVLVDSRRQVFQLLGDGQARRGHSSHGAAATEGLSCGHRSRARVAAQPDLPDRLGGPSRLRRQAGDSQALFRRRLETRVQGAQQAGAARGVPIGRRRTA